MKTAAFFACWGVLLVGVVLIAIALGVVAGPAAVCGFLGIVLVAGGLGAAFALAPQAETEVPE